MYKIIKLKNKSTVTIINNIIDRDLFIKFLDKINSTELISVGNISDSCLDLVEEKGVHITKSKNSNKFSVISFIFDNQIKITAMPGGVTPLTTENDFNYNIECLFLRYISFQGKFVPVKWKNEVLIPIDEAISWHESYNGRFGYIISGLDPEFKCYKHSCSLGEKKDILTAITFDQNKRKGLIQIS